LVQDEEELDMPKEWWEDEYQSNDDLVYLGDNLSQNDDPPRSRIIRYENHVPHSMINRSYSDEEKRWLRPICETLAMLQGNAFFGFDAIDNREWYEQWLPEAAAIFYGNGGSTGRAGEASWMKDLKHETASVEKAWQAWKTIKALSQTE